MRAIILAAGFGKRMMPLTENNHKVLLEIGGVPVLGRIVDALAKNDIYDLTIVTGYHAKALQDYMSAAHPEARVQWIHNEKYDTTNNIYSLALALAELPDDDALLIECDLVFQPEIISALLRAPYDATALLSAYEPGMDGTVVSLANDVITAIHPPHLQGGDFVIADKFKTVNIYKFSRRFISESLRKLTTFYANSVNDNCYYELVLGVMIYMQSNLIHGVVVDSALWSEIDDPVDMQTTEFKFNPAKQLATLEETHGAYWNYPIEDFCYVQNAYFPTPGMLSMLRHHMPLLITSFGSSQKNIDRKLSYYLECDPDNVVALNGSCEVFPWLKQKFTGKSVLTPEPTFGEYPRNFPNAKHYSDRVGVDRAELDSAIGHADLIVLVNPNNPTGSPLHTAWIAKAAKDHPDKVFLVDESFVMFSDQPSIMEFLKKNPDCNNVLVLQSLGKALGVPGLRIGYVYGHDKRLLDELRQSLPIWNMNSVAEYFLELLLKNRRSLEQSIALVKRARELLFERLQTLDCIETVYPSQGCFLLTKLGSANPSSKQLPALLLERHGIYVKDVSSKFHDGSTYLRFAVKTVEANERLVAAIEDCTRYSEPHRRS